MPSQVQYFLFFFSSFFFLDRKSTRLNSSHPSISYAVFCLKKKKKPGQQGGNDQKPSQQTQNPGQKPGQQGGQQPDHKPGQQGGHFFFNAAAPTEIYTLSLHDALPI